MRASAFFVIALLSGPPLTTAGKFDVILRIDDESARRTVALLEGLSGNPSSIAELRGSQIALATTALLAQERMETSDLVSALEAAKFNHLSSSDPFRLRQGKEHLNELKELVEAVGRRNLGQRVVSTVEQLFPDETDIRTVIPVYFVAFGHENIDAFVRRVVWKGDTPVFVGEGEGELTIVVNLAKAVSYGRVLDERFIGLLSVVAHEVFHATFGVFKDGSPEWRRYYSTRRDFIDHLLDLTHNEGIAHYLSLIQRTGGKLRNDQLEKVSGAFAEFNRTASLLRAGSVSAQRAVELIRHSNSSGYWESFGAITGMIVARQIDQSLGRQALMETIARGPDDFFGKYASLMRKDPSLPALGQDVIDSIRDD
jgi:hypothetical protein